MQVELPRVRSYHTTVGMGVSKGKSMVAIISPFGEIVSTPFEIKHTSNDINSLIELINSIEGESRIVIEHTGRYYEALAHDGTTPSLLTIIMCHTHSQL